MSAAGGAPTVERFYGGGAGGALVLQLFEYRARTAFCALRVPASAATARFLEFAEAVVEAHALGAPLDRDADALLFYGAAYNGDGPGSSALRADWYPTLVSRYSAGDATRWRCYYRVVRGCPARDVARVAVVQVDFRGADGSVETSDVVLPRDAATYGELERRLGRDGPLRACAPSQAVPLGQGDSLANVARVVVEVVPDDQRALAVGERLLPVTLAEFGTANYLQPRGAPFFLKVARGQTLGEVAPAVFAALAVAEDAAKKARFFTGTTWVTYAASSALKPETDVGAIPYGHALFVLVDLKRHTRTRPLEEALHIAN
jgi:hypothetical protein